MNSKCLRLKEYEGGRVTGAPGETRTPDPLLRRQLLYPTELQARFRLIHWIGLHTGL